MRFWLCYNPKCADSHKITAGHRFMSDVPVCDRCGVDGRDPKFADIIAKVKLIHFDPPGPVEGRGQNVLACQPNRSVIGAMATGSVNIVNCPMCRKTEAWKQAKAALGAGVDEIVETREAV